MVYRFDPTSRLATMVGDFNFTAEGEIYSKLHELGGGIVDRSFSVPVLSGSMTRSWRTILDDWTELSSPFPPTMTSRGEPAAELIMLGPQA